MEENAHSQVVRPSVPNTYRKFQKAKWQHNYAIQNFGYTMTADRVEWSVGKMIVIKLLWWSWLRIYTFKLTTKAG